MEVDKNILMLLANSSSWELALNIADNQGLDAAKLIDAVLPFIEEGDWRLKENLLLVKMCRELENKIMWGHA